GIYQRSTPKKNSKQQHIHYLRYLQIPRFLFLKGVLHRRKKRQQQSTRNDQQNDHTDNHGFTRGAAYFGGDQETLRKLTEMKMGGMAELYEQQNQNKTFNDMGFDEPTAAIEDIEYHSDRNLDKNLILELATGNYIQNNHNIILMGASGNGKTWISNAFGVHACRQFYKVKYIRLPELLDELAVAKYEADGSFRKINQKYKKIDVLILDEWLLTELTEEKALHVLEIIESR